MCHRTRQLCSPVQLQHLKTLAKSLLLHQACRFYSMSGSPERCTDFFNLNPKTSCCDDLLQYSSDICNRCSQHKKLVDNAVSRYLKHAPRPYLQADKLLLSLTKSITYHTYTHQHMRIDLNVCTIHKNRVSFKIV